MTDLITRARKEWCERHFAMTRFSGERHIETDPPLFFCPPDVVAALLDVLREAKADGCGTYCTICGGERKFTGIRTWTFKHTTDCAIVKAEAAITRALEGKP
jgi:hypothetical protein